MAFNLHGIGTHYYGLRLLPGGAYVTTRWVVIIYIPIIPIGSVRVVAEEIPFAALYSGYSFKAVPVPLDVKMVIGLYVRGGLAFLGLIVAFLCLDLILYLVTY